MTGNTLTLADVLRGIVDILKNGVADLVIIVCGTIGAALCLYAMWRLYLSTIESRAMGDDVRASTGATAAFVIAALLALVGLVAARISSLYTGT